MAKEYFISFILLFAFSVGLAHDIIPHHHHDIEDMKHHSHHHDSEHHHHEDILGYFAHISHSINRNDFDNSTTQNLKIKYSVDKSLPIGYLRPDNPLLILNTLFAVLRRYSGGNHYILPDKKQTFYFSLSLRGPPSLST